MNENTLIFILIVIALVIILAIRWGWAYAKQSSRARRDAAYLRQRPIRGRRENDTGLLNPAAIPEGVNSVSLMLYCRETTVDTSVYVWLFPDNHPHTHYIGMGGDGAAMAHENAIWTYRGDDDLDAAARQNLIQRAEQRFSGSLARLEKAGWRVTNRPNDKPKARLYYLTRT